MTEISTCSEAIRVLAEHLDDELDAGLQRELLGHLATCRSCYSRAEFERQLKEQVRTLASEPVPPAVTHRMQGLLREFSGN